MDRTRKSVQAMTKAALRKCRRASQTSVMAYCTPAEYVVLCWHFGIDQADGHLDYYERLVRVGISGCRWHYFEVQRSVAEMFKEYVWP